MFEDSIIKRLKEIVEKEEKASKREIINEIRMIIDKYEQAKRNLKF